MIIPFIQIAIAFFISMAIVYYAIPVIVSISIAKNLYDVPNERKLNKTVIPNLGGVALFVGISIGTMLGILKDSFPDARYIMASTLILFFVGIKDDILVISAFKKFIAQLLCAIIITVIGNIRLTDFHGIFGLHEINYSFSILVSLITIVGTINAVNLIDGIDGLAASISILASTLLGAMFFFLGNIGYSVLCFATTGSLISFFIFNVFGKKHKIFMGDTGSLILGLILSVCVLKFNELTIGGDEVMYNFSPILSLAILAVPLFDMVRIIFERVMYRKSPFAPDMNHIHHKYLNIGLTHRMTTAVIVTANISIIGIILTCKTLNNQFSLILLTFMVAVLMAVPGLIFRYKKKSKEKTSPQQMQLQSYLIPNKSVFATKSQTSSLKRKDYQKETDTETDHLRYSRNDKLKV